MAGVLFEDIFDVKDIDPDGKKFERGVYCICWLCHVLLVLLTVVCRLCLLFCLLAEYIYQKTTVPQWLAYIIIASHWYQCSELSNKLLCPWIA